MGMDKDGEQPLKKKGNGCAIHVSDFVTERGHLMLSEEEEAINNQHMLNMRVKPDAQVIMYPGKGHDAWWDGPQLLKQVCSYVTVMLDVGGVLGACHAPSQLDLGEPSHTHIHLTTDHDSTQLNTSPCMGNAEYSPTQTSLTSLDISRQAGMVH